MKFMTINKVAKAMGVSPSTARRMVDKGLIPSTRSPGGWRLVPSDVAIYRAVTVTEAAGILGVSPQTVRRMVDANILRGTYMVGNRRMIPLWSIYEYIETVTPNQDIAERMAAQLGALYSAKST